MDWKEASPSQKRFPWVEDRAQRSLKPHTQSWGWGWQVRGAVYSSWSEEIARWVSHARRGTVGWNGAPGPQTKASTAAQFPTFLVEGGLKLQLC